MGRRAISVPFFKWGRLSAPAELRCQQLSGHIPQAATLTCMVLRNRRRCDHGTRNGLLRTVSQLALRRKTFRKFSPRDQHGPRRRLRTAIAIAEVPVKVGYRASGLSLTAVDATWRAASVRRSHSRLRRRRRRRRCFSSRRGPRLTGIQVQLKGELRSGSSLGSPCRSPLAGPLGNPAGHPRGRGLHCHE